MVNQLLSLACSMELVGKPGHSRMPVVLLLH